MVFHAETLRVDQAVLELLLQRGFGCGSCDHGHALAREIGYDVYGCVRATGTIYAGDDV